MNSIWIIPEISSEDFFLWKERAECNCFKEQTLYKSLEREYLKLKILSEHIWYIQVSALSGFLFSLHFKGQC